MDKISKKKVKIAVLVTVFMLIIIAAIIFRPNSLNSNWIISDEEYRTIMKNWKILQASELFESMAYSDDDIPDNIRGLWEWLSVACSVVGFNEASVDERIYLYDKELIEDDTTRISRDHAFFDGELYIGDGMNGIRFSTDHFFAVPAIRNKVNQMLYIIENGLDSQWSLILPRLIKSKKSHDLISVTIYDHVDKKFDEFRIDPISRKCEYNGKKSVMIPSVPDRSAIGYTEKQILALFGEDRLYISIARYSPSYVTEDGYLVIFNLSDRSKTVDRILVFDLLDLSKEPVEII